jgi:Flp pilus assembly protein protease CpaA
MSDESKTPDDVSRSMMVTTIIVVIVLPSIVAAVIGAVIGYPVNGIAGAVAAGLFLGLAGFFIGTFAYWLIGPVDIRPLPAALITLTIAAALVILFVL